MTNQKNLSENKMGTKPVWSLLLGMALPVMLSTAVQSLYNVVDGIFVSQLGEYALAAISFSSPLVNIMTAVGSGIAVGMNTMLSHALGEKDQKKADSAVNAALWVLLGAGILAVMAAFTLSTPYLSMMTNDPVIYEAGLQYIHICMGLAIMSMGQLVFERMLIATGKTSLSMISQGVGGILNLILDPVLIFGLGPFPAMGISGAAAATVFSQAVAMTLALTLNLKKNYDVHIRFAKPSGAVLRRLLFLGAPTAVIMSLNSIMMVNFNAVLNQFSTTAVAVFGACCRTTSFFYALLNAMCSATIPIIAYNHGAKNKRRIDQAIRFGYLYSGILMTIGTVLCVGFPEVFLRLFNATDEMIEIGVWGMQMLCCCYVFCAVRNMSGCILQALGYSVASTATDLTRNYAILIPFAWLFSLTGSLSAVWLSIPLADVVSAIVGFLLMLRAYRRDIKPMERENALCSKGISYHTI